MVTAKRNWSFDELKALWDDPLHDPGCTNPECPNARRVHILAESITITNLIVAAGDLTPELREALTRVSA